MCDWGRLAVVMVESRKRTVVIMVGERDAEMRERERERVLSVPF